MEGMQQGNHFPCRHCGAPLVAETLRAEPARMGTALCCPSCGATVPYTVVGWLLSLPGTPLADALAEQLPLDTADTAQGVVIGEEVIDGQPSSA